jgi:hypothetical protein
MPLLTLDGESMAYSADHGQSPRWFDKAGEAACHVVPELVGVTS